MRGFVCDIRFQRKSSNGPMFHFSSSSMLHRIFSRITEFIGLSFHLLQAVFFYCIFFFVHISEKMTIESNDKFQYLWNMSLFLSCLYFFFIWSFLFQWNRFFVSHFVNNNLQLFYFFFLSHTLVQIFSFFLLLLPINFFEQTLNLLLVNGSLMYGNEHNTAEFLQQQQKIAFLSHNLTIETKIGMQNQWTIHQE